MDAAQGVEAQTVSNAYLAIENDLTIIPVINKVDLPSAMVDEVTMQVVELIGCQEEKLLKQVLKVELELMKYSQL